MSSSGILDQSFTETSKVDVIVTKSGALWFLHDTPLAHSIAWVEYDPEHKSLTIITNDGSSLNLGMNTTEMMEPYLLTTLNANFGLVKDSRVEDVQVAPVTIHQRGVC